MRYRTLSAAGAAAAVALIFSPARAAQQELPPPVQSNSGMVVSVNGYASDIGAAILAQGGNAVDAAVATAFALAVVHPAAGNLGGGGFMVVRPANGTGATTFDYREKAPLKSTPTMYLDSAGNIARLPDSTGRLTMTLTSRGYLAPGVPGTVKGLALAHQRFGKLKWKTVVAPAADLAEKGFVLSAPLASSINSE